MDAAIAVNAALGLMEPMSCGIGGDLYAIVWDAKTRKLYGLNASGRIPLKASCQWFKENGHDAIPDRGPLSWSVPGCVDGWDQLRQRFGTMSFKELLDPSIRYAEEGVPVPEVIAGYWRGSERLLARDPGLSEAFLVPGDDGKRRAPRVGEVFKNPHLAWSYRQIAEGGRDAFYQGEIARKIVALSDKTGGLFTLEGLRGQLADLGRAGEDDLPRLRGVGTAAAGPGDRGAPDAQPAGAVRPQEARPHVARVLAPARRGEEAGLRGPRQILRRPGVRQGPRRDPREQAVRRRPAEAHRPGEGGGRRGVPATRSSGRPTRPTCAWWTRTATACR